MSGSEQKIGRYEVLRRIATGGMGEIFLGRQTGMAGFDRFVILKTLLPQYVDNQEMRDQFLDEGRIVGSINHPNVVAMYEMGDDDGTYYIAMEHINGVDTATLAREAEKVGASLPVHVVAAIARDAASGLDSAHHAVDRDGKQLHIVHRDVSPQNIMVRRDGNVKIVDFGIAAAENRANVTSSGMLKGKFSYLAPEQIQGSAVDGRTDQFALGIVTWELLTGQRLFKVDNQLEVFKLIMSEAIMPPSAYNKLVPPALDAIVLRMLERDPAQRYARCSDVALAVQGVVNALSGSVDQVAAFVEQMVGEKLKTQLERIGKDASKPSAEQVVCARCGEVQPNSNRYCAGCGARTTVGHTDQFAAAPERSSGTPTGHTPARATRSNPALGTAPADIELATGPLLPAARAASASSPGLSPASLPAAAPAGQRMPVTVIWYRVLGLGALRAEVPPQAVAAGVAELQRRLQPLVESHGGALVSLGADVGVVLFGTNGATDDDADAAIRCAVEMPRILEEVHPALDGRIALRSAIASGDADVGPGGVRGPPLVNAQRICDAEEEPAVLLTQSTQHISSRLAPPTARQVTALDDDSMPFSAAELVGSVGRASQGFLGRDAVLAELTQVFEAAARSLAPARVILGDAGIGKSAVLREAALMASRKGLVIAPATCGSVQAPTPLNDVRQLVRSLCENVAEALRDRSTVDIGIAGGSSWTDALRQLKLTDADQQRLRHLVTGREPPEAMALGVQRTLQRATLVRFFGAVARDLGLCLLIDDLHLMDSFSLEILTYSLSLFSGCRVACVATARPTLSPLLWPNVRRVALDPLPPDAIEEVTRDVALLGRDALALVTERSAGNPTAARACAQLLFARELMVQQRGEWLLKPDIERTKVPITGPQIMQALWMTLSDVARGEARLQATFGEHWLPDVEVRSGADAATRHSLIDECVRHGLVTADRRGSVTFMQPTLREVAAAAASSDKTELRQIRRALADRIERVLASPDPPQWPALKEALVHFLVVDDDRRRSHVATLAAARAQREVGIGAFATDWGVRALTPGAQPHLKALADAVPNALFEMAGLATEALGDANHAQAADLMTVVFAVLPARASPRAAAVCLRKQGIALANQQKLAAAEAALETALELASFARDELLAAQVQADFASIIDESGDPRAAVQQLTTLLASLPAFDDPVTWEARLQLARLHIRLRDFDAARAALESAQTEVARTASLLGQAEVFSCEATLAADEGDLDRALELGARAIEYADAAGDIVASVEHRQAAARRLLGAGHHAEARQLLLAGLDLAAAGAWHQGYAGTAQMIAALTQQPARQRT